MEEFVDVTFPNGAKIPLSEEGIVRAVRELPDRYLGYFFELISMENVVREKGRTVADIPPGAWSIFRNWYANFEVRNANDTVTISCLRAISNGDYVTAGRLFRNHMISGAEAIVNAKYAPIGIRHTRNMRDLGKRGKKASSQEGDDNRHQVYEAAIPILEKLTGSISVKGLARLVCRKTTLAESTVRRHINTLMRLGDLPTERIQRPRRR